MRTSPEVRAQRKAAHLARIAKKGDPDYPAMYAAQPREVRVQAEQTAQRQAIAEAKRAIENALAADALGAVEVFGGSIATAQAAANEAAAESTGELAT